MKFIYLIFGVDNIFFNFFCINKEIQTLYKERHKIENKYIKCEILLMYSVIYYKNSRRRQIYTQYRLL